jgi:hypothetical protein
MPASIFRSRHHVALAATVCVAALAASTIFTSTSSQAATPSAAAAPATPTCRTSALVVWLNTQGNGTAGSTYYSLGFTNLSRRACHLLGYPGVSAVDLGGRRLGSAASRDHSRRPNLVTLTRGATATAVLRIIDAGNFPTASCRPVTAAGLLVFPPNRTAPKLIPFPFRACSRAGPVYLSVQVVVQKR